MTELALQVSGLTKVFKVWKRPGDMLVEALTGRQKHTDFCALDNVSFEMPKGSVLGVLGRNGAGKSTLLRLIAGTLEKSSGKVAVSGNIAAILELGTGFHPDYTGRENVFLGGLCMGLTKKEIKRRFDEIVEFAELQDFIEQPFRTYSSGMKARLTFAVATSVDPDILIIDEALSVGDARFSLKSFDRIQDFRRRGKAILFVSHDINMVNTFCDTAILLEHGKLIGSGEAKTVGNAYHELLFGGQKSVTPLLRNRARGAGGEGDKTEKDADEIAAGDASVAAEEGAPEAQLLARAQEVVEEPPPPEPEEPDTGKASITEFYIRDAEGRQVVRMENLADYEFVIGVAAETDCKNIVVGIKVRSVRGAELYSGDTLQLKQPVLKRLAAGETARVVARFRNVIAPGVYFASVSLSRTNGEVHQELSDAVEMSVEEAPGIFHNSYANLEVDFRFGAVMAKVS